MGLHEQRRQVYGAMLERSPDHPVIRRNALVSLQYDPNVSTSDRLKRARDWGKGVVSKSDGPHLRPVRGSRNGEALRVGYVSAELCQYTVGWFVKDVLKSHDPGRVEAYVYSATPTEDWITAAIRDTSLFRAVGELSVLLWPDR